MLLNCRGVTEIAIASVGYQAGLISPFAYAMLCGLALVTTAVTAPLFRALTRRSRDVPETAQSHIPAGLASQTQSR
ncbi:putative solute/hydrogen antiporter [Microlunatus phosphovorus NM-1]|uniref:Putative solute/hydrogen antiporter n=1 Tax=Microlunatus phosphovorus (strain ATCC 700054 / DSM 10555 / JCM 9379 / NBRC 101784 / NCIMB 13414 / VKM Ac-1990 / NM-1) TaxID=1032480 RepID=F5XI59_MICPN|nr:putative solute/hydrogen antiporter [Microlunatus phosphovorus NM-1]